MVGIERVFQSSRDIVRVTPENLGLAPICEVRIKSKSNELDRRRLQEKVVSLSARRSPVALDKAPSDKQFLSLTVDELVKLLDAIPEPFRTAVFLDGASGFRVSELLGLKWKM